MWKTLGETKIPDILQFVAEASKDGQAVHIGTDSLQTGRFTQFVTVVVILTPRKGGRVAYRREVVPRITSLARAAAEGGLEVRRPRPAVHLDRERRPHRPHRREPGRRVQEQRLRPGAGRPRRRPGLQGAHQARELGCFARRGPRGPCAGEAPPAGTVRWSIIISVSASGQVASTRVGWPSGEALVRKTS